ncbi:hypothetical protein Salat_0600700 [Sesamum alatum]|uniref:Zinc finger GRF-type domain-containing protein n=1 Tax=Sesamum alatum TaxID=300844 RepID=A0AAE1YQH6_9LAMI|nr:hypothetical protein Salat_0600700 [Sesamum alatum]
MSTITGSIDCYCGRRVVLRTSWTEVNPGRRFHSCREYKEGSSNNPRSVEEEKRHGSRNFEAEKNSKEFVDLHCCPFFVVVALHMGRIQLLYEELGKLQRIEDEVGWWEG